VKGEGIGGPQIAPPFEKTLFFVFFIQSKWCEEAFLALKTSKDAI
jgi:hypothetical protein